MHRRPPTPWQLLLLLTLPSLLLQKRGLQLLLLLLLVLIACTLLACVMARCSLLLLLPLLMHLSLAVLESAILRMVFPVVRSAGVGMSQSFAMKRKNT